MLPKIFGHKTTEKLNIEVLPARCSTRSSNGAGKRGQTRLLSLTIFIRAVAHFWAKSTPPMGASKVCSARCCSVMARHCLLAQNSGFFAVALQTKDIAEQQRWTA